MRSETYYNATLEEQGKSVEKTVSRFAVWPTLTWHRTKASPSAEVAGGDSDAFQLADMKKQRFRNG